MPLGQRSKKVKSEYYLKKLVYKNKNFLNTERELQAQN